ncbi:hypothetical protein EV668_1456 [Enterovirga rhinocerotis]|uniref:Uncharacterized protein n=1 Tax=Enterovirga rhinocerotis TaxID=1339210 RepID=A0A4R7C707_9HYPH|nr:hypothetical protein EV668_1456 [Enterovirga rhinocerotis]
MSLVRCLLEAVARLPGSLRAAMARALRREA